MEDKEIQYKVGDLVKIYQSGIYRVAAKREEARPHPYGNRVGTTKIYTILTLMKAYDSTFRPIKKSKKKLDWDAQYVTPAEKWCIQSINTYTDLLNTIKKDEFNKRTSV